MAVRTRIRPPDRPSPNNPHRSRSAVWVPLLAAAVVIYGLMVMIGLLLVHDAAPAFVRAGDVQLSERAFELRTPTLDQLTHFGSMVADTVVALVVTAVAVIALRLWLGRWRESLVLIVAIVGELLIFLAITATVHRDRPSVPHLDPAPPTSSFPSGHTGAAVALYGCLAVIVLRAIRSRWLAVSLAAMFALVPVVVAVSRVYRGMHFPSDVLAGALAAGAWLVVVLIVLLPKNPRPAAAGDSAAPG